MKRGHGHFSQPPAPALLTRRTLWSRTRGQGTPGCGRSCCSRGERFQEPVLAQTGQRNGHGPACRERRDSPQRHAPLRSPLQNRSELGTRRLLLARGAAGGRCLWKYAETARSAPIRSSRHYHSPALLPQSFPGLLKALTAVPEARSQRLQPSWAKRCEDSLRKGKSRRAANFQQAPVIRLRPPGPRLHPHAEDAAT